jgi:hypothetical protein
VTMPRPSSPTPRRSSLPLLCWLERQCRRSEVARCNALPAVMAVVNASPLSDQDKTKIGIDLTVAQIVLSSVLAALPATADPASAASGV